MDHGHGRRHVFLNQYNLPHHLEVLHDIRRLARGSTVVKGGKGVDGGGVSRGLGRSRGTVRRHEGGGGQGRLWHVLGTVVHRITVSVRPPPGTRGQMAA